MFSVCTMQGGSVLFDGVSKNRLVVAQAAMCKTPVATRTGSAGPNTDEHDANTKPIADKVEQYEKPTPVRKDSFFAFCFS